MRIPNGISSGQGQAGSGEVVAVEKSRLKIIKGG